MSIAPSSANLPAKQDVSERKQIREHKSGFCIQRKKKSGILDISRLLNAGSAYLRFDACAELAVLQSEPWWWIY